SGGFWRSGPFDSPHEGQAMSPLGLPSALVQDRSFPSVRRPLDSTTVDRGLSGAAQPEMTDLAPGERVDPAPSTLAPTLHHPRPAIRGKEPRRDRTDIRKFAANPARRSSVWQWSIPFNLAFDMAPDVAAHLEPHKVRIAYREARFEWGNGQGERHLAANDVFD